MLTVILTGLWLGLVFNVAPGPVFTESLRRGVRGGFRPALAVQLGSLVGDAVWAVLGLAGAAALMTQPTLRIPVTLTGCMVLALLGISGIRDALRSRDQGHPADPTADTGQAAVPGQRAAGRAAAPSDTAGRHSVRSALIAGALMSLATVWNVVYWGGAGGAVAGALGTDATLEALGIFLVAFMTVSVAWCFVCAGLIAGMRRALSPGWIRMVEGLAGMALILMAGWLAVETLTALR